MPTQTGYLALALLATIGALASVGWIVAARNPVGSGTRFSEDQTAPRSPEKRSHTVVFEKKHAGYVSQLRNRGVPDRSLPLILWTHEKYEDSLLADSLSNPELADVLRTIEQHKAEEKEELEPRLLALQAWVKSSASANDRQARLYAIEKAEEILAVEAKVRMWQDSRLRIVDGADSRNSRTELSKTLLDLNVAPDPKLLSGQEPDSQDITALREELSDKVNEILRTGGIPPEVFDEGLKDLLIGKSMRISYEKYLLSLISSNTRDYRDQEIKAIRDSLPTPAGGW